MGGVMAMTMMGGLTEGRRRLGLVSILPSNAKPMCGW